LKIILLVISCIFFACNFQLKAQTQNNLDLIYKLIDKSVAKTDSLLGGKQTINLSITAAQPLEILKPFVLQAFNNRGYQLKANDGKAELSVNYTLISVNVEYKNSYSDGLFAEIALEREIKINGSISLIKSNHIVKPFGFTETRMDTVQLNEITDLEDKSVPFTQGQIPSQPLLSTFWEPIVVVGTLIAAVILLFTVRSK
jgi:hypothetical protein